MIDDMYAVHPPDVALAESWMDEAGEWSNLARGVVLEGYYSALTIKALYVAGLIYECFLAVDILLRPHVSTPTTFYPAYSVFSSAVELLGRALTGNRSGAKTGADLTMGFRWIASPEVGAFECVEDSHVLVTTANSPYTIADLVALRNFSAHGQAINRSKVGYFDFLILGELQPIVSSAMTSYLRELRSEQSLSTTLASANILPFRNNPVFDIIWTFLSDAEAFPEKVGKAVTAMDWSYKSPLARFGRDNRGE